MFISPAAAKTSAILQRISKENSKALFPEPRKIALAKNIIEVRVDPKIAFAMILRQERIRSHLSQMQVAKKLGLKNTYSYQRLENSKTANPSLTTIVSLKSIFPDLDLETIVAPG